MDVVAVFVVNGISWGRNVIGLMTRPYETSRRIVERSRFGELVFIALISALYFILASIVKIAAFRPFVLTREFLILFTGAFLGYAGIVVAILAVSRLVGAAPKVSAIMVSWGYTLFPTVCWFFMTSVLYVLFPPPRTTSGMGVLFSVLFLVVSATFFWWKIMLSYLSLRFALRIDAAKIAVAASVLIPTVIVESYLLYRFGIFKIPFL